MANFPKYKLLKETSDRDIKAPIGSIFEVWYPEYQKKHNDLEKDYIYTYNLRKGSEGIFIVKWGWIKDHPDFFKEIHG